MSLVQNQWVGQGLAAGTAISAGNVNTSGNGTTVTLQTSGSPTLTTAGHGLRVVGTASDIGRLDASIAASTLRLQAVVTVQETAPSDNAWLAVARSASAQAAALAISPANQIMLVNQGSEIVIPSVAPAAAAGDRLLLDAIIWPGASSTTGRALMRVRNLTSAAWNGGTAWVYDASNLDLGTAALAAVRWGKQNAASLDVVLEYLGWDAVTPTAGESTAALTARLADAPAPPIDVSPITASGRAVIDVRSASGGSGTITHTVTGAAGAVAELVEGAFVVEQTTGAQTVTVTSTDGVRVTATTVTVPALPTGQVAGWRVQTMMPDGTLAG